MKKVVMKINQLLTVVPDLMVAQKPMGKELARGIRSAHIIRRAPLAQCVAQVVGDGDAAWAPAFLNERRLVGVFRAGAMLVGLFPGGIQRFQCGKVNLLGHISPFC